MSFLQDKIKEASQKYYSGEESGVSDEQFDEMLEELREQDPNDPILTATGHGYVVELDSTEGMKVRHHYGDVGSLNKCHNWKEYKGAKSCIASLKLDGLSVVLYYESGKLTQALTRGKDNIGIDITNKVKAILPEECHTLSCPGQFGTCGVRGEILMSYPNFQEFLQIHPEAKNPRNSAAGLINGNEITEEFKFLDIVVYNVVGIESSTLSYCPNYEELHQWLCKNFTDVVKCEPLELDEEDFDAAMDFLQSKWYGYYPADGIVLSNLWTVVCDLGQRRYEIAYDSIAYKFPTKSKKTRVAEVEWNLSKTRYLIPVVNFEPIDLAGTTVSKATGINAQYILENRIGPRAVIEVTKANEIIPQIIKIHHPSDEEELVPVICPECGHELIWNGVHLQCVNRGCMNGSVQDVLVWMDKIAPYDNLGDSLRLKFLNDMFGERLSIEEIYRHGPINYVETKTIRYNDFQKAFNKMFRKDIKLSDAIEALNIPRIGPITSQKLARHPDAVKAMLYYTVSDCDDEPRPLYDWLIGDANFKSLEEHYWKLTRLWNIKDNIIWEEDEVEQNGKVAITGKLSVKRQEFELELKRYGYEPVSTINKETKFLVTDDPTTSTSKNLKADKLGITKITEQEFREKYMR